MDVISSTYGGKEEYIQNYNREIRMQETFERHRCRWEDSNKGELKETASADMDLVQIAQVLSPVADSCVDDD
jgi:hypothetical protein